MEAVIQMMLDLTADKPWALAGLAAGLLLRTLWPWLELRPRPPFDWTALWPALLGGLVAYGPLIAAIDPAKPELAQFVACALVAYGSQSGVRKALKRHQKPYLPTAQPGQVNQP